MKRATPRFLYGFLSASADAINMRLPWQPSDKDGLFKMNYSTVNAESDNLKLWAHTNKGERPMDFEFGLDARRYLFEQIPVARDNIIQNARQQLKKYFPHLIIEELRVLSADEDNTIDQNSIRFFLSVRPSYNKEIVISINEVIN